MVTARQTLVLVDRDERRPIEVPAELRAAIAQFERDDLEA
jgi:acyl-CoA thioesterase FadM